MRAANVRPTDRSTAELEFAHDTNIVQVVRFCDSGGASGSLAVECVEVGAGRPGVTPNCATAELLSRI
jgi:hypothetical protein